MPWCPNCKTEYEEGYLKCGNCGTELVEAVEEQAVGPDEYNCEAFLKSVHNDMEAVIVEAKLSQYGIPVRRKYRESGAFMSIYMGATAFGIDLLVPSELLEDAQKIAAEDELRSDDMTDAAEQADEDAGMGILEEKYRRKRMSRAWLILLFFTPGLIWLLYALFGALSRLFQGK